MVVGTFRRYVWRFQQEQQQRLVKNARKVVYGTQLEIQVRLDQSESAM